MMTGTETEMELGTETETGTGIDTMKGTEIGREIEVIGIETEIGIGIETEKEIEISEIIQTGTEKETGDMKDLIALEEVMRERETGIFQTG